MLSWACKQPLSAISCGWDVASCHTMLWHSSWYCEFPAVMNCERKQTHPSPTLLLVRAFYCSSRNECGQSWTGVRRHPVTLSSAVETQDPDALPHELEHEVCYGTHAFPTRLAISKDDDACFLTTCVKFGMLLQLFQSHLLLEEQRGWITSSQFSPLVIGFCTLILWCLLVIYCPCMSWFFSSSLATINSGVMGLNLVGRKGKGNLEWKGSSSKTFFKSPKWWL